MHKVLFFIGFMLLMVATALLDSEDWRIPVALLALGLLIMLLTHLRIEDEKDNRDSYHDNHFDDYF